MSAGSELPTGTVTFLFTDIEGSTRLLKQLRDRWAEVLGTHQELLRQAFADHGGWEIDTQGDSFFIAFRRAKDAVAAAVAAQVALARHEWPDGAELRVRMGLHTGEPAVGGERYVGLGVHRAARISAAGHGGQVLVSQTTRELLRDDPPTGVSLRDLGEHQLKDIDEPERIYQLVAPGLIEEFPPLKTSGPTAFEGREGELVGAAQDAVEVMTRSRRRRRRLLVGAGVVVLATIGTVLGLVLSSGGGTARAANEVVANAVGVIDPENGRIAAQIPVGIAPGGVAAGNDTVWVTNGDGNSVSRIDAKTNDVRQTIAVGSAPTGVAANGNTVWVANGLDGTLSRINAETNLVVQTPVVGNGPKGVAYGNGAVWVANSADGTVSRIDADSGRVTRTVPVAIGVSAIAIGFGQVWVASSSSGGVFALDPHTGDIVDRIGVGVDPGALAAGAGAVWVANRADGTVSRIDPRARVVTDTINVGRSPAAVAIDAGGVWVANSGDGTLSKIDPESGRVIETVHLTNRPQGIALTSGRLYVAVRSTGRSHRGGTLRVIAPGGLDAVDPAISYSADGWAILSMTNDGLLGFRRAAGIEGTQLVPDLARVVPSAADGGTTYTFRLRPNLRYSNGTVVRAEDFRRALERVFESKPESAGARYYNQLVGAERCKPGRACDLSAAIATNEPARTVTFHLKAPDADFLTKLALPFAFAVPASRTAREARTHRVPATGPYMIASYAKRIVRLVRNPRFREWSADAQPNGFPDVITFTEQKTPDPLARAKAIEAGAADIAPGYGPPLTTQQIEEIATRYPSQLHSSAAPTTLSFFLNTRVPPFDDVRVRRAVNLAFDREAFAKVVGRGFAPTCQILPPNYPSYRRTCPFLPGGVAGLDQARTLVRRSGKAGASVTVWIPVLARPQGAFMVSVLKSLGFHTRLQVVPGPITAYFDHVADSRSRAQAGFYAWLSDFPSVAELLQPQFGCAGFVPGSPRQTTNVSEFCNDAIDRQLTHAAAVQAQDPAAASDIWQEIERAILAQAPLVPTANLQNVDFVSKRIRNYQFHPQWGSLLDQLWVK